MAQLNNGFTKKNSSNSCRCATYCDASKYKLLPTILWELMEIGKNALLNFVLFTIDLVQ